MKRQTVIAFVFAAILVFSGCTSILEDETLSYSPHTTSTSERPPEEQIEVSGYEGLKAAMLDLIMGHETNGLIVVYSYDGDIVEDVDQAVNEIMTGDTVAIYAVAEINGTVTRIVSFFEIDVSIEYKRTKEQVDSYVTVSTLRGLRTELLSVMSDYREEAVFLMSLQVTEDDMAGYVKEAYYQNPRSIVMMPVTVVETLPAGGNERFFELRFGNTLQASMLRQYGALLTGSVRRNVLAAEGENDAEILLSLVENLMGACAYDEGTARTISEHGVQNIAATAYGALFTGNAVGEGFAMAFKAICDEMGFDCRVVLGYRDGMVHAWNIVSLNGDFYHVDVAMCALNGVETAFIKTDANFIDMYTWDVSNYVKCNGKLTYEDIVGVVDDKTDGEETGESDDEADDGEDGETDDETDHGTDDEADETYDQIDDEPLGIPEQTTGDAP